MFIETPCTWKTLENLMFIETPCTWKTLEKLMFIETLYMENSGESDVY